MVRPQKLKETRTIPSKVVFGVDQKIGIVVWTDIIPVPNGQIAGSLHSKIVEDAEICLVLC